MAGTRKKRRKSKNRANRTHFTLEQLEAVAQQSLASKRFRDAIGHFKDLLKREERSQWRKGLEAAYRGRALELTAKGMLNEALVIWENCRQLTPDSPMPWEHIKLLCDMGRIGEAVAGYRAVLETLDSKDVVLLRSSFAALYLIEPEVMDAGLPADDPVITHGADARSALDAYCNGDDQAVARALDNIPFRSPYRDWVQLLKGLQKLPDEPDRAEQLLNRLPPNSPFSHVGRAIRSALEPESTFITRLAELDDASRRFSAALRGWPEQRLQLWEKLHTLGDLSKPEILTNWLFRHQEQLGEGWIRRHALRLLINEYPRSCNWFPKGARPSPLERELIMAWRVEEEGEPWEVFDAWMNVIHQIEQAKTIVPGSDDALRIALIQRRLDSRWMLLREPGRAYDFEDLSADTLAGLEESLQLDPDDQPTYLRLIGWYRDRNRLQDARRLLDLAMQRWPEYLMVLIEALETAEAGSDFKKAAGFAHRILKLDPVNARAKNSLLEAHLAHPRKQIRKGRLDLTEKELQAAEEWAQGVKAKARLDLLRGLFIMDQNPEQGMALLVTATDRLGGGITGRLDLAIEIQRLGHNLTTVVKKLGLPKIKSPEKNDLMAFFRTVREHLDKKMKIPLAVLRYFTQPLKAGSKLPLTQQESEVVCESLRRCGLNEVRLAYARAALKRWPGIPLFELHAFEAKFEGRYWNVSAAELDRLETALEVAQTNGDKRTALRIQEALRESTPFSPFSPHEPVGSPDALSEMLDDIGIEAIFDLLNRAGMSPTQLQELERMMGDDGPSAFLEGMLEEDEFDSMDEPFDLPEPPRPKKMKKKSSSKASANKKREDNSQPPPTKQLNLFE